MKLLSIFILGITLTGVSCWFGSPPPLPTASDPSNSPPLPPPPTTTRYVPKRPDPKKQEKCKDRGRRDCEGNEDCEDICDDIFSRRADKKDCYELPEELVSEFEKIIEHTEDGDIKNIHPADLECLLDIDEREFASAVKKMSRREASEFWLAISEDESLAEILEDEDDEYMILKQLLHKMTGSHTDTERFLTRKIEDDKTVLWLAAEGSEPAWDWLDGYVSERCDSSSSSCQEPIDAYCTALLDMRDRDLEDFLSDADLFADEFEDEVEDAGFEYDVDDDNGFREFCEFSGGNFSSGECPERNPPSEYRLARITLHSSNNNYVVSGGFCASDGTTPTIQPAAGSSSPNQDILLSLDDANDGTLFLDTRQLLGQPRNDGDYYIYIGNNRYTSGNFQRNHYGLSTDTSTCSHTPNAAERDIRRYLGFLAGGGSLSGTVEVWIAVEEDGNCRYFTDP